MYYTNKQKTMIVSFTIKKVIEYRNDELAHFANKNLKELQQKKDTFGDIIIPDFNFELNDNIIWYESVFIKGLPISNLEMESIVWPLCVMREDRFTINNYDRYNFIRCQDSKDIYFIDLNDCYHSSIDERKRSFAKNVCLL
jgi:hypothetical protein